MYQVIINDKFYIKYIDGLFTYRGDGSLLGFEATIEKEEGKLFDNKVTAYDIAEQVGGKVITYIMVKDTNVEVDNQKSRLEGIVNE